MSSRAIAMVLAWALSCLGCTDKRPSVQPLPSSAGSAPAVAGSAASTSAAAAASPASQPEAATPIAIDQYDERDALRLMPAVAFVRFKTEAGTLYCAAGLCTAVETLTDPYSHFTSSYHAVKWTPQATAVSVGATRDPSDDPTYSIEGREIAGEDVYVPGDGCVYIRQSGNAFFPITKRYCLDANGTLERQPQRDGIFPLAHTTRIKEPLQVFETSEGKRTVDVVPEQEQVIVMAALVSDVGDLGDEFSWLQVRTQRNIIGWIRMPESYLFGKCNDRTGNQKKICYLGD